MTLMEEIQLRLTRLTPEKQNEVLNFIAFLQERSQSIRPLPVGAERGRRIKAALLKLTEMRVFAEIQDPVEWQRQTRKDRILPGRTA